LIRQTSVSFWHYHIAIIIIIIITVILLVTCVSSALCQTNVPNILAVISSAAHVQLHSLWDWRVHNIILCIYVYINSDPKLILKFNHFSVAPSPMPGQYSKVRGSHTYTEVGGRATRALPPDSSLRGRKLFDRLNSDRPLSITVLITLVLPPSFDVQLILVYSYTSLIN